MNNNSDYKYSSSFIDESSNNFVLNRFDTARKDYLKKYFYWFCVVLVGLICYFLLFNLAKIPSDIRFFFKIISLIIFIILVILIVIGIKNIFNRQKYKRKILSDYIYNNYSYLDYYYLKAPDDLIVNNNGQSLWHYGEVYKSSDYINGFYKNTSFNYFELSCYTNTSFGKNNTHIKNFIGGCLIIDCISNLNGPIAFERLQRKKMPNRGPIYNANFIYPCYKVYTKIQSFNSLYNTYVYDYTDLDKILTDKFFTLLSYLESLTDDCILIGFKDNKIFIGLSGLNLFPSSSSVRKNKKALSKADESILILNKIIELVI